MSNRLIHSNISGVERHSVSLPLITAPFCVGRNFEISIHADVEFGSRKRKLDANRNGFAFTNQEVLCARNAGQPQVDQNGRNVD